MQLDLKLPSKVRKPERTFRMDKNALVECIGDAEFIYGHWDRHFGCWVKDYATGVTIECVPDWPFLDAAGHGRDPGMSKQSKHVARAFIRECSDADVAFFAYFQAVPHSLRRLVSSLGPLQWFALDCVYLDPEFELFLDSLQRAGQLNYFRLVFSAAEAHNLSRAQRKNLAVEFRTTKRAEFLNHISELFDISKGRPWNSTLLKLLYKLNEPLLGMDDVRLFLELTSNAQTMNYASHAEQFSLAGLQAFEALRRNCPAGVRLPNLIECFSQMWETEIIPDIVENAVQKLSADRVRRLFQKTSQIRDDDDLLTWFYAVEDELIFCEILPIRFPSPPIAADDFLIPLDSAVKLEAEARRMRNCIRSKALSVVEGLAYYFHWRGPEEATIELERDRAGEWGLAEALGRGNQPLSCEAREVIENHIIARLDPHFQTYEFDL